MNEQSPDKVDHSANAQGASPVSSRLDEMKSILEARVKAQPENAEAWRELGKIAPPEHLAKGLTCGSLVLD